MWDDKDVRRYNSWYETRQGSFAFACEARLLDRMVSIWPRRNQKLLEVGCGPGRFLEKFWEAGFDVTGLDRSVEMIDVARERVGNHADLHVGHACHLPFEDNEFDFAAMLTVMEFVDDPVCAIREVARVARKGLILAFLNRYSFYYLQKGMHLPLADKKTTLRQARWFTLPQVKALVREAVGNRPMKAGATLPGPTWTWKKAPPLCWANRHFCPPFLGAWCALRVDLSGGAPLTPLYAFKTERA